MSVTHAHIHTLTHANGRGREGRRQTERDAQMLKVGMKLAVC